MYRNSGKKQLLSKHQISCQNIRHQKYLSKHQKWQHWLVRKPKFPRKILYISA